MLSSVDNIIIKTIILVHPKNCQDLEPIPSQQQCDALPVVSYQTIRSKLVGSTAYTFVCTQPERLGVTMDILVCRLDLHLSPKLFFSLKKKNLRVYKSHAYVGFVVINLLL